MQNTLLALAFAVIGAFAGALFGPMLVDWDTRKPQIAAEASRLIGRPVTLKGPVSLTLLPTPTLSLADAEIGQAPGSRLSVQRMKAEVLLAPMVRGEIALGALQFDKPVLRLAGDADESQLVLPPIGQLTIRDGRLEIGEGPRPFVLSGIEAKGEGQGGGLRLTGALTTGGGKWSGQALLSATTGLSLSVRANGPDGVTLEGESKVTLGASPRLTGPVALAQSGAFRLKGQAEISLDGARLPSFEASLGERGALAVTGALDMPASGLWRMDLSTLRADLGPAPPPAAAPLASTPQPTPPLTPLAALAQKGEALLPAALRAHPLELQARIGEAVLAGQALRDVQLTAVRDGTWRLTGLSARTGDGSLARFDEGALSLTTPQPERLLAFLTGAPLPAGASAIGPLELAARVETDNDGFGLTVSKAQAAAFAAQGRVRFSAGGIEAQLAFPTLALEAVPLLRQGLAPLGLGSARGRLALAAESLTLAGLPVGRVTLAGGLSNGVVSLDSVDAQGADGTQLRGQGLFLAADPAQKAEGSGRVQFGAEPRFVPAALKALGLALPDSLPAAALTGLTLTGEGTLTAGRWRLALNGRTPAGLVQAEGDGALASGLARLSLTLGAPDLAALVAASGWPYPPLTHEPGTLALDVAPQGTGLAVTARAESAAWRVALSGWLAAGGKSGEGTLTADLARPDHVGGLIGLPPLFGEGALTFTGPARWSPDGFALDLTGASETELRVTRDSGACPALCACRSWTFPRWCRCFLLNGRARPPCLIRWRRCGPTLP